MLLKIEDLEQILGWDGAESTPKSSQGFRYQTEELSVEERIIVDLLLQNNNELPIDEISWKSQINISKIASLLLNLEFRGIIKPLPGKKFKLL
jgi:DNA processing protein